MAAEASLGDGALASLQAQLDTMAIELASLRDATSRKSSKQIGNEGEAFTAKHLQLLFADGVVTCTARDGNACDLRLELPLPGSGETASFLVEVKRHSATVPQIHVDAFLDTLADHPDLAGGLFVALTSTVAGEADFAVSLGGDGRADAVFLHHVEEAPGKLKLAIEFLLARHRHREASPGASGMHREATQRLRRQLRTVAQLEQSLQRRLQAATADLAKLATARQEAEAAL